VAAAAAESAQEQRLEEQGARVESEEPVRAMDAPVMN